VPRIRGDDVNLGSVEGAVDMCAAGGVEGQSVGDVGVQRGRGKAGRRVSCREVVVVLLGSYL